MTDAGTGTFERVASEFESGDLDWVYGRPVDLRLAYNNDRRKLLGDVARDCRIEPVETELASGLVFTPATPMHDRAIVYFHGGGWVVGSPATHQVPCSHLAVRSRHAVWSMRYGLAPENPFPRQREDAINAIAAVLECFDRVILAGDSAGAAVAFWGLHDLPHHLLSRVDGIVGLYGSYGRIPPEADGNDPLSPREIRAMFARLGPLTSLPAIPGFDIVDALPAEGPPVFLSVGDADPLIGDTRAMVSRLHTLGREVELEVIAGLGHSFAHFVEQLPDAGKALMSIADWIRERKRLRSS
ncbi:MAG: alpha/beta hydrolase fold domain-containing protein [Geminicoccaceae bacterium]|nr:alpha/beta hydrolase fold domain-containing protein [Geminicoccaceae bacterium]